MRRIEFDYPITCPRIDKEIERAKSEIENFVFDLLEEACPLLSKERRTELAVDYGASLYSNLEDAFETVRATNEDMRRAADRQIADLFEEIAALESRVEN